MVVALGVLVAILAIAIAIGLGLTALNQIRQLRVELDETQRQVNELRSATPEATRPVQPPPLPKSRSTGLDDLREELRAAHREEAASEE